MHLQARFPNGNVIGRNICFRILWIGDGPRRPGKLRDRQRIHKWSQRARIEYGRNRCLTLSIANRETCKRKATVLQKTTSCDQNSVSPC